MLSEKTNKIYIGIGSNLGESRVHLYQALRLINHYFKVPLIASSVYRSAPVEFLDQPWFLNQVAEIRLESFWRPTAVLRVLKEIESAMGREKTFRYGPRLIDLDLLLYGNWVFESEGLIIPHPKIEERAFVLQPLVELNPELTSPRTGHRYEAVLQAKGMNLGVCIRLEYKVRKLNGKAP